MNAWGASGEAARNEGGSPIKENISSFLPLICIILLFLSPCVAIIIIIIIIVIKKGEQYANTISWIRTRTSFALLRSALVCLRGSRTRRVPCDIKNVDIDVEVVEGAIQSDY